MFMKNKAEFFKQYLKHKDDLQLKKINSITFGNRRHVPTYSEIIKRNNEIWDRNHSGGISQPKFKSTEPVKIKKMKITNKGVGYFILATIFVRMNWYIVSNLNVIEVSTKKLVGIFIAIDVFLSFCFLLGLLADGIKFSIEIPNPFEKAIQAYKQRRLFLKELEETQVRMMLAEGNEFDRLLNKEERLKNQLKLK